MQIEHAIIKGIKDNKIHCTNDNGVLSLRDVSWILDGDTTFSTGALRFKNSVDFVGEATFAYQSSQTSTVLAKSELELDNGITFSYDPIVIASKDLFEFEDETSVLSLNGATLHTTVTGMNLTKGKIRIKRDSYLSAETEVQNGQLIDEGISFGNQVSLNDCKLDFYGGETLYLTQGSINYKNVLASSLHFSSLNSSIYLYPSTKLNLYQNLSLAPGYLTIGNKATIGRAVGKTMTGSIRPLGKYFNTSL